MKPATVRAETPETSPSPSGEGRGYGKRKLPDARGKFIAVRCSDAEYATITAAAAQAGLSVGAYLRTLALGSPGLRAVRRPPIEKEFLARMLGELGKVGSNVNQMARVLNTTGDRPSWYELSAITSALQETRAAILKALGRGD